MPVSRLQFAIVCVAVLGSSQLALAQTPPDGSGRIAAS